MEERDEDDHDDRSVVVRGLQASQPNLRKLEIYFQSKRRSGGGDVLTVKPSSDGSIQVVFDEAEHGVAKRVCLRRHELDGQPLLVEMARGSSLRCSGTHSLSSSLCPTTRRERSREAVISTVPNLTTQSRSLAPNCSLFKNPLAGSACSNRDPAEGSRNRPGIPSEGVPELGRGPNAAIESTPAALDNGYSIDVESHAPLNTPVNTSLVPEGPRIHGADGDFAESGYRWGVGDLPSKENFAWREAYRPVRETADTDTRMGPLFSSTAGPTQAGYGGGSGGSFPLTFDDAPEWQVKVEGLPKNTSRERLRAYFESDSSLSGSLRQIHISPEDGNAYLTFENDNDAARVCQNDNHWFHGQRLTIIPFNVPTAARHAMRSPPPHDARPCVSSSPTRVLDEANRTPTASPRQERPKANDTEVPEHEWADGEAAVTACDRESMDEFSSTVEVRGIPEAADKVALEMYFENKKRSGGANIKRMFYNKASGTAKIIYLEAEVVKRVCSKKHNLLGCALQVVPFTVEQLPVTKVLVSGFSEQVDKDMLEMYFESKKRSGGDGMIEVVMGPSFGQAVVSYASEEVTRRVCAQEHHLCGCGLTVTPYQETCNTDNEEEDRKRLVVFDLPANVTEDMMELYFESKKRSGGGDIANLKIHCEHATAVIVFSDQSAVARICERSHKLLGCDIRVAPYSRDLDPDFAPALQPCTVEVVFPGNMVDKDTLEMYFESHKRSGGGDIVGIHIHPSSRSALVTFADPQVAAEVASRSHKLQSSCLKTSLVSQKKGGVNESESSLTAFETNKLLLLNIPEEASEELLKLYIHTQTKVEVESLEVRRENCRTLAVLKEPFDFPSAAERVEKNRLCGSSLSLRRVQVSRTLRIDNFAEAKLNEEYIGLYFKSKDHHVTVNISSGYADLTFSSRKEAEVVCHAKHVLNNIVLNLHPVVAGWDFEFPETEQESLSEDGAAKTTTVEAFSLDVRAELLNFLLANVNFCDKLQDKLSSVHASVSDISSTPLVIHPTKGSEKVFDWQKKAQRVCDVFFGDLHHVECKVSEEVLEVIIVEGELPLRLAPLKKSLILRWDVNTGRVFFTGTKYAVQQAEEELAKASDNIQESFQRREQELLRVKPDHVSLLQKSKSFDKLERRYRHTNIKIGDQQGYILLEGPQREIRLAMSDITKCTGEMFYLDIDFQIAPINQVMASQQGLGYAQAVVDHSQLEAVVTTRPGSAHGLRLVGWNSDEFELEAAKERLQGRIAEEKYVLQSCEEEALQNPKWKTIVHTVSKNYLVHLVAPSHGAGNGSVVMFGVTEHIRQVRGLLATYFEENAILAEQLELKPGQVRYLQTYEGGTIDSMKARYKEHQVNVQITNGKLCIRGTQKGVELAVGSCEKLLKEVAETSMEITQPGMKKYFAKDEAKKQLATVEKNLRVVIEQDAALLPGASQVASISTTGRNQPNVVVTARLKSGMKLSIYRGDITRHACDALVNAANEKLDHIGGVAQAIVKAGGTEIQDECHKHVRNNGKLLVGDVFVSKAGHLPCKCIVHAVGPNWSGGRSNETRYLQHAVQNSLQAAVNLNSIAFPAISTGVFGFPVQLAVEIMVNTVLEFSQSYGGSVQLQDVHFVDQSEKVISAFQDVMSDIFQGGNEGTLMWPGQAGLSGCGRVSQVPARRVPSTGARQGRSSDRSTAQSSANSVTTAEGKVVTIVQGDLSQEKVDVIVNSAAGSLNLSQGMVAKVLSQAAGPGLQRACSAHVAQSGELAAGSFAVTDGYQLHCKKVFHLVLCQYNGGGGCQVLEDGLVAVFTEASRLGFRSISLPSLGTGTLQFPPRVAAQSMLNAVETFSRLAPVGRLNNFRFAVFDKQMAAKFFAVVSSRRPAHHAEDDDNFGEYEEAGSYFGSEYSDGGRLAQAAEADLETEAEIKNEGDILCGALPGHQLQIHLFQGDIVHERSDAIVIAANSHLGLENGAVLQAIARAGGHKLQQECNRVASALDLRAGDVCSTSGGNLPCKKIIHAIVPQYSRQGQSIWALQDVILAALREADKLGMKTVSLPALGTGVVLCYPVAESAESTLTSVCKFAAHSRHVSTVRLVVFDKTHLAAFQQEFKKQLSGVQVTPATEPGFLRKLTQIVGLTAKENPQPSGLSTSTTARLSSMESPLWLRIYGPSTAAVKDAKKEVEDLQTTQHRDHVINNESIGDLTRNDEARIYQVGEEFGVYITIEKGRINRLRVRGDAMGVADASSKIHEIISNAADAARTERNADITAQVVEWVQLKHGTEVPYDKYNNYKLEDTYQANKSSVDIVVNRMQVTVDLKRMVEMKSGKVLNSVQRNDLSKKDKLPSFWDPQQGKKCLHITLQPHSKEYKTVKRRFQQTSSRQIIQIQRVQNPELYNQYNAKKDSMENAASSQNGANEMRLFHGSDPQTIMKICTQGFNRSFAGRNATMYGKGVYFARDASYSENYSAAHVNHHGQTTYQMIQALVLVGDFCQGSNNMISPNPRSSKDPLDLCDSTVDSTSNPSIIVTYTDSQTYPEYVIFFQ